MIEELLKIIDKVNINELGMRQKLEDEIRRFNKLQKIVNGKSGNELVEENDVNIRQYAKYQWSSNHSGRPAAITLILLGFFFILKVARES